MSWSQKEIRRKRILTCYNCITCNNRSYSLVVLNSLFISSENHRYIRTSGGELTEWIKFEKIEIKLNKKWSKLYSIIFHALNIKLFSIILR